MLRLHLGTRLLIGSLFAGLVVGCAPFKFPEKIALPIHNDKPQVPLRMTALWTDTVLVEAGIVGFGGRIMFYGRDEDEPVIVDGELTVYAYDDTEDARDGSVPARKYVFRAEELSKHYSKSTFGHSYSFWLPWAPVGGPQRQISLIARFRSTAGGVIMSEVTRHFLPGAQNPDPAPSRAAAARKTPAPPAGDAQRTSHEEAAEPLPDEHAAMTTATINLPPRLARALNDQAARQRGQEVADEQQSGAPAADTANGPAQRDARIPAEAESAGLTASQALAREVHARREALASRAGTSPEDRFARRRFPARIAPKLPPTRDPARLPQRPAESPSGPPPTPPTGPSNEWPANEPNALPAQTEPLRAGGQ